MNRVVHLIRASFPERPVFGAAVSRAILQRVAASELGETVRIGRPGRVVAFGKRDTASVGYASAVEAARRAGYEAVERLAGGRAALYTEGTLSLSHAQRDSDPRRVTEARFAETAELLRDALRKLGVDARIGEVAGEYCPGEFSVNARGQVKLAGIGQRLIAGGAHVGGVVVVNGAGEVRRVLAPVYEALGLDWDPVAAGSVEDEVAGADLAAVEGAIVDALGDRYELVEGELDRETLALAEQLAAEHAAPG